MRADFNPGGRKPSGGEPSAARAPALVTLPAAVDVSKQASTKPMPAAQTRYHGRGRDPSAPREGSLFDRLFR